MGGGTIFHLGKILGLSHPRHSPSNALSLKYLPPCPSPVTLWHPRTRAVVARSAFVFLLGILAGV